MQPDISTGIEHYERVLLGLAVREELESFMLEKGLLMDGYELTKALRSAGTLCQC